MAIARLSLPEMAVASPTWNRSMPLYDTSMFSPDGSAAAGPTRSSPLGSAIATPDESGSAAANHGTDATHVPVPNSIANPATRPIHLVDFMAAPLVSTHP